MSFATGNAWKNHIALLAGCYAGCFLSIPTSRAWAADTVKITEGSTAMHRSAVDGDSGQVYIYIGGALPAETHLVTFEFLYDFAGPEGNTSGYITPILFERVYDGPYVLYTVAGIGLGFKVNLDTAPQPIYFNVVEGIKVPTNGDFTFGYINAFVDAKGEALVRSPGTVDYDESADPGEGVGGSGTTNDWAVTAQGPPFPVVTLGTTFGSYGSGADFNFFSTSRTYSARASGVVFAK